ncbi:MAG: YkgJ family cysteine cluster protein [Planctomycetaceae bacterium]|nr:YkgJ family cysteine cluster protein [Planctomycetaceae bacterium]
MGMCESCHAGCCRSYAIPINGADIIRMERESKLTFWEFACRWADPQGEIAGNYAPHFHFQDEPETQFVICLKQIESKVLPGTQCCQFLQEGEPDAEHPLGISRCGMYLGRPAACRVFPTKYDVEHELPILHTVPKYGREEQNPAYQLCPRQWVKEDVDPIAVAHELMIARYEVSFFNHIAEAWNRSPKPWDMFPGFIRDVYANRISTQSDIELLHAATSKTETPSTISMQQPSTIKMHQ